MTLKEGFSGSHERVPEGLKVSAIAEFLGENVSAVDFSGNMFYLDCKVFLLAFAEKNFSGIEIFVAFCCCFLPVLACTVVVLDDGG